VFTLKADISGGGRLGGLVPNPAVDRLSAIVRYQERKRTRCKDYVRNNLCAREHFSTDYHSL